jgi:hypothetical protein
MRGLKLYSYHSAMKYSFLLFLFILTILTSCKDDEVVPDPEPEMGTLEFGFRMPGQMGLLQTDSQTCQLIDVGFQMAEFSVGKMNLVDGKSIDEYTWTTLYKREVPESLTYSYYRDRGDVQVTLSPGDYNATRLRQNYYVAWKLLTPQGDTIIAIDENRTNCEHDKDGLGFFYQYLDSTGTFFDTEGKLKRCTSDGSEGLGQFSIRAGGKTKVVMRMNISQIDWIDNDKSGDWSDGDELDNYQTYDGSPLMMYYEVTYGA